MTNTSNASTVTAFRSHQCIASGDRADVARAIAAGMADDPSVILVFDDRTGRQIDLDPRHQEPTPDKPAPARGRPKLGVAAREITLLPRHWDWLAAQPGGASATLRKLVEAASRESRPQDRSRAARDAAYHAMSALAGDLSGFEEASRALFAGDADRFAAQISAWPADVINYITRLANPAEEA